MQAGDVPDGHGVQPAAAGEAGTTEFCLDNPDFRRIVRNIEDTYRRLGTRGRAVVSFHHDGLTFREIVVEDFVARIKL